MTTNNSLFPKALLTLVAGLISSYAFGQALVSGQINSGRIPTPTMLFLNVAPDARSAGMGDAGVAISSDVNAIYWNPAKLATAEKDLGFSISYTPWLRNLVNDMALYNIAGYKKTSKDQAFGFSINYFEITKVDYDKFFFQFGKTFVYSLKCVAYTGGYEPITTGILEIDSVDYSNETELNLGTNAAVKEKETTLRVFDEMNPFDF